MVALDLRPIRARHDWAHGHGERVLQLVTEWRATALAADVTYDDEKKVFVHKARVAVEPPLDIALALGDALHQARATLDNLVSVLRGSATATSGYPVAQTAEDFNTQTKTKLEGVPPWAVDVIRRLQPFSTEGWRWVGDALWPLHQMAIIDRHRALVIQAGIVDIDQVYVASDHPGETTFRLSRDSQLLTIETPDPNANPHLGATVWLNEPLLQQPGFPFYPDVLEFVDHVVRAVGAVIDMIDNEAASQPVDPPMSAGRDR